MNLATKVGWGGRTLTPQGSLSPPMGSGHFPDLNYAHASFFREISFRNTSKRNSGPEHYQVEEYIDKPTCFGFRFYGDVRESLHHFLQFGGPGGNCGPWLVWTLKNKYILLLIIIISDDFFFYHFHIFINIYNISILKKLLEKWL